MRPPSCLDSDGSCDLRTASHLERVTRMLQDRLIGVAAHLAMLERAVLFFPHILILADVVLEAADIVQNLGTDPDKRRTGDSHASVAADSFDGPRFPPRVLTSTTRKPCRPSATTISRSVVKSRTARPRRTSSAPSGSSAVMSDESMRRRRRRAQTPRSSAESQTVYDHLTRAYRSLGNCYRRAAANNTDCDLFPERSSA